MIDPLKGFEELAKEWESVEPPHAADYVFVCNAHARRLRELLAAARAEIKQQKRDEFVAGAKQGMLAHAAGERPDWKAEAARRNP
jgi:hypothetical protein